jgi:hypothetical protein
MVEMGVELEEAIEALQIIQKYDPKALIVRGPEKHYQFYVALDSDRFWKPEKDYPHPEEEYEQSGHPMSSDEDNLRLIKLGWWYENGVRPYWTCFY